jgi:hypothetical protein
MQTLVIRVLRRVWNGLFCQRSCSQEVKMCRWKLAQLGIRYIRRSQIRIPCNIRQSVSFNKLDLGSLICWQQKPISDKSSVISLWNPSSGCYMMSTGIGKESGIVQSSWRVGRKKRTVPDAVCYVMVCVHQEVNWIYFPINMTRWSIRASVHKARTLNSDSAIVWPWTAATILSSGDQLLAGGHH